MPHPTRRARRCASCVERPGLPAADGGGDRRTAEQRHLPPETAARTRLHRARADRAGPRRPRLEHFYRASQRAYFDEEAWQALNERERLELIWSRCGMISKDITTAMAAGHLLRRGHSEPMPRRRWSSTPTAGRKSPSLLERATKELFEIEARVAERTAEAASRPTSTPVCRCSNSARRVRRRATSRGRLAADRLADEVLDPVRSRGVRLPGLPRDFFSSSRTRSARFGQVVLDPVAALLGRARGRSPRPFSRGLSSRSRARRWRRSRWAWPEGTRRRAVLTAD